MGVHHRRAAPPPEACAAARSDRTGGFAGELGRIGLEDLSLEVVKRAAAALRRRRGYAPTSRARMLAALKGFCRWLVVERHLPQDPTVRLEGPERPGRLPAAFTGAELDRIVAIASAPHTGARRQWPTRNRAIVAVLAGAGLRATELCDLEVGDFLAEHAPLLKVAGKGDWERRVTVAAEVAAALDAYLAERATRLGPPSPTDRLFVRAGGEAMTRQGLNHHVAAGWPGPASQSRRARPLTPSATPTPRGSCPRGVPLAAVQALLGHASLATTQVYLRMAGAELTDAAQGAEVRDALRAMQRAPRPPGPSDTRLSTASLAPHAGRRAVVPMRGAEAAGAAET